MNNKGFYIIPFRISDKDLFVDHLSKVGFQKYDNIFLIRYLLRYTVEQDKNGQKMFESFTISSEIKNLSDFFDLDEKLALQKISIVLFKNNIGYLIYKMKYLTDDVNQIIEISSNMKVYVNNYKKNSLQKSTDYLLGTLGGNVQVLFHLSADANKNCHIFQYLSVEDFKMISDEQKFRLRNSYDASFKYIENDFTHSNFEYTPFPYIYWGASQNTLVCLTENRDPENRIFLQEVFPINIENDYLFMYILTLHQRYSSFAFMFDVSRYKNNDRKITEINRNITKFQLESSFYVISDERVYQNLYSMLRETMDIESLFQDIKEINERFKNISDDYNTKRERTSGMAITVLSLLTVFSALIDLSSFLDRFIDSDFINSGISCLVIILTVLSSILMYLYYIKRL